MLKERMRIKEDDGIFADTYFKSAVFRYVEEKYGKGIFARRALKVYTTVEPGLQRAAEEAVKRGLQVYDEGAASMLCPTGWTREMGQFRER